MNRLGAEWRTYRTKVIPLDAPAIQARECRRAFYAGANALLVVVLAMLDPGTDPTERDLSNMDEIARELEQFADDILSGPRMNALLTIRAPWREVRHPIPVPLLTVRDLIHGGDIPATMPRLRTCTTPYPEPICSCGLYFIEWVAP